MKKSESYLLVDTGNETSSLTFNFTNVFLYEVSIETRVWVEDFLGFSTYIGFETKEHRDVKRSSDNITDPPQL